MRTNGFLLCGGVLSALAAILHLAIIAGGPAWYRFFGAGERMARIAERNWMHAGAYAVAIAAVLAVWSGYALAGAGLLPRPPLLRTGLIVIAAVYLVRGLAPLAIFVGRPALATPFWIWSSLIVLAYGAVHALGLWTAWSTLRPR